MTLTPARPDRRQFGRRQTRLHGWIKVPGRPAQPCLVTDISVGGARIECERPETLPFTFELLIEASRFRTMCEVRHYRSSSVGVKFSEPLQEQPATPQARGYAARSRIDDRAEWMG